MFSNKTSNIIASIHIHSGRYTNTSDITITWDGKHVYRGRYTNTSDILYIYDLLDDRIEGVRNA